MKMKDKLKLVGIMIGCAIIASLVMRAVHWIVPGPRLNHYICVEDYRGHDCSYLEPTKESNVAQ